jgi:secreted Zn-dependent insulinase-like peptidase
LPSDILIGSSLYLNFDPEIISTILSYLSPDKCNIRLISRSFSDECHKKADWFNTLYTDEKINDEWIALFQDPPPNPRLHLPRPNTFIPTDFDLISDNDAPKTKYPILIDETSYYKLWYKKDDIFDLPKASICLLLITSQENYTNIKNFVMMELFVGLFNSTVTELVYEATEAQYKYSIDITSNGLSVEINGFSHKLSELFKVLVEFLSKFDACESFFQMRKVSCVKVGDDYEVYYKPCNHHLLSCYIM